MDTRPADAEFAILAAAARSRYAEPKPAAPGIAMPDGSTDPFILTTLAELDAIYGVPGGASVVKETDRLHPVYAAFVRAAPFVVLATGGPGGLDASPRGDQPGFVEIDDEKTLLMPDRRGNNRIDSLRNIVAEPRVALLFLIPGVGETLRVNGRAEISTSPALLERFSVECKTPKTVLVIRIDTVYFQCSRAIARSGLWSLDAQIPRSSLPSAGEILSALSPGFDGRGYDQALDARVKATLY